MALSGKAQKVYADVVRQGTKLGDLRKIAKAINKDHDLAMELWATGEFYPRLLATLIMDVKRIDQPFVDMLVNDMLQHDYDERTQLADWLMANQLAKDKRTIGLLQSWENSHSALQRRLFWYYQGRLRWVGQKPPGNTEHLLSAIEEKMPNEEPEVQWAMNFTAGWIGVFETGYCKRCISIGEKLGLYKDEVVARGCTPSYLPAFIDIEVKKRNKPV